MIENILRQLTQNRGGMAETLGHATILTMNKTRILPVDGNEAESNDADDGEFTWDGPSKSQRKRESTALQDLGAELVELSADRLKKIDMPENLRDALRDAQRITSHGAKRRQMQLIGKIMRNVEIEPLQSALDEVKGISTAANIRQHKLERLRTDLLANEAAFGDLARDYPGADIQRLRQLRRNALKETEQQKPPRAYRELFRELRDLVEAAEKVGVGGTASEDA
jgi:ribosome-associated protein